jgi:hypothetical protein
MKPIVVYCPSFDENSGGAIVLHVLVDKLRKLGVPAYVVPYLFQFVPYQGIFSKTPSFLRIRLITKLIYFFRFMQYKSKMAFKLSSDLNTPLAKAEIIKNAIIVYPESVNGNPLGGTQIVRWLLHKPQFINKNAFFDDENELLFYFNSDFKGQYQSLPKERHLHVKWVRHDIYNKIGALDYAEREETCYLVRKGVLYGMNPQNLVAEGKVVLDGMSHQQCAYFFKKAKYFISYDNFTAYNLYATLCGCVSIIVPPYGVSEDDYFKDKVKYPGIALGYSQIDWARETSDDLCEVIRLEEEDEIQMLRNFLDIVNRHKW